MISRGSWGLRAFPECVEDQVHGRSKVDKQERNAEIARLYFEENKTCWQLAGQFGLNLRTIKRVIARYSQNPLS